MDQFQSLNEIVNMILRRIPVWGSIVVIGIVASVYYAFSLPRAYETTAVIQIGNSQISQRIGDNTGGASLTQYLRKIEQKIMARENLIKIIASHQLYADAPAMTSADKVLQLRLATRIEQVIDPGQAWRPDATPSALTVTVRLGDRELAARVANDFVERVLEQSRSVRLEQAGRTLAFFESEERRVGAAISELDAKIANFKGRYAESLPSAMPARHEMLVSLENAKLTMDQQIVELNNGKAKIRKAEFQQQLELAEDQLELIITRRDTVQASIDAGPLVEKEFNTLKRSLKQLEDQYAVITNNRAKAEIGQMLETGAQSNQLSVLEEALVPDWPVSPNRKKIVIVGSMLSLLVAAAAILVLELMNPVIRTAAQLERQLQITPVITIPIIKTSNDRAIQRFVLAVGIVIAGFGIWQFIQYITRSAG